VKVPADRSIDGRDIRPLLSSKLSEEKKVDPFKFIYSYSRNQPAAIRQGPWKLHVRLGSQLNDNYGFEATYEKPLLFQVEQDLEESFDCASQQPERVKQMLKEMVSLRN
jgi:arylsulfatase A